MGGYFSEREQETKRRRVFGLWRLDLEAKKNGGKFSKLVWVKTNFQATAQVTWLE